MTMRSDTLDRGTAHIANPMPAPPSPLQRVVRSGLLRCAVPTPLGGSGGSMDDLAHAAGLMRQEDPEAAAVLWAQRLAIEALVHTYNVGLRELWLPDLLGGTRAATRAPGAVPLVGEDTGRGWRLSGRLHGVPNLPWEGFSLVAPVRLGGSGAGWVLLRSEEDGLSVQPAPQAHAHASLRLSGVFFREDEWLGDQAMDKHLAPVGCALAGCRPSFRA